MSWSVDLLLVSGKSLQAVVEDIGCILCLPVKKMENDEELYFIEKLEAQLVIGYNNLVNDDELILEKYNILVSIWSTKLPDWQVSEEECRNIGGILFEKLKEIYGTSLLLTENAQKRLLAFDPAP